MILLLAAIALSDLSTETLPASNKVTGAEGDSCLATADCGGSLECRNAACVPQGMYTNCQRTADCPARLRCRANQCVLPGLEAVNAPPAPARTYPVGLPYGQTFPYEHGAPIPAGMHVEKRTVPGVWGTGIGLLASGWLVSGIMGTLGLGSPVCWLPIIGAFVSPATTYTTYPGANVGTIALQIPLGIVQTLGGVLILAGVLAKKEVLVFDGFKLSAAPMVSPTVQGMSFQGEF